MKKKGLVILIIFITLFTVLLLWGLFLYLYSPLKNDIKCQNNCIREGWEDGKCEWPSNMNETYWNIHFKKQIDESNLTFPYSEIENRGSCVVAFLGTKSKHCGNKGQCNCYCFNSK